MSNLVYDKNGALLSKTDASGSTAYSYDGAGRMKLAAPPTGADRTELVYDGNGARIQKKIGQVGSQTTTTYFNDTRGLATVLQEQKAADPSNPISYLPGLAQFDPTKVGSAQWAYFHADAISSRALTDGAGTVSKRWDYDPFGVPRAAANDPAAASSDFQFAGEQKDATTGLINLRARSYDPALGRFLSRDVLAGTPGFPQSYNRYTYALNNPLRVIDPSGYKAISPGQCTGSTPGCEYVFEEFAYHGSDAVYEVDNSSEALEQRQQKINYIRTTYGIKVQDYYLNNVLDLGEHSQNFNADQLDSIIKALDRMAIKLAGSVENGAVRVTNLLGLTSNGTPTGRQLIIAFSTDNRTTSGGYAAYLDKTRAANILKGLPAGEVNYDELTTSGVVILRPPAFDPRQEGIALTHELGHVADYFNAQYWVYDSWHGRWITNISWDYSNESQSFGHLYKRVTANEQFADAFTKYFYKDYKGNYGQIWEHSDQFIDRLIRYTNPGFDYYK